MQDCSSSHAIEGKAHAIFMFTIPISENRDFLCKERENHEY